MSAITDVVFVEHYVAQPTEELIKKICDFGDPDSTMSPRVSPLQRVDPEGAGGTKYFTSSLFAAAWNYLPLHEFLEHLKGVADADEPLNTWTLVIHDEYVDTPVLFVKRQAATLTSKAPPFPADGEVLCPVCTWPNPDSETNCGQCGSNLRGV